MYDGPVRGARKIVDDGVHAFRGRERLQKKKNKYNSGVGNVPPCLPPPDPEK